MASGVVSPLPGQAHVYFRNNPVAPSWAALPQLSRRPLVHKVFLHPHLAPAHVGSASRRSAPSTTCTSAIDLLILSACSRGWAFTSKPSLLFSAITSYLLILGEPFVSVAQGFEMGPLPLSLSYGYADLSLNFSEEKRLQMD